MPSPSPTPTEETSQQTHLSGDEEPSRETDYGREVYVPPPTDPDAPVSFVPHVSVQSTARLHPLRVRSGRYGELEQHELVQLLDTMEDERARARFRESVYISVFVWIAIALTALFGPKYLWHAPKVTLPSEVLRRRELSTLVAPTLTAPRLRSSPPPSIDSRTLEHLRSMAPKTPAAPPPPAQPAPRPSVPTRSLPSAPTPNLQPSTAPPNLPMPSAPQPVTPRAAPPVVADAPRPQPSARPNFGGVPQSASDSIQQAIHSATRGGGGGGAVSHNHGGTDLGMGPAEILSDTQGVNFQPYLRRILQEIYDQWIPLIPEEAHPPLRKSGTTMIRFTILPDGNLGIMNLDGSSHDQALNKAAWGSITGVGQFPPLPPQFHGPNLELRIHFLVNQDTE